MTTYNIYTDTSGRIAAVYTNCDTAAPNPAYTKTIQQDGTPPVIDPFYIPAPQPPQQSIEERLSAVETALGIAGGNKTPPAQVG